MNEMKKQKRNFEMPIAFKSNLTGSLKDVILNLKRVEEISKREGFEDIQIRYYTHDWESATPSFHGIRDETDEELQERIEREKRRERLRFEEEFREYERLKRIFEK